MDGLGLIGFAATVALISLSGVMAPGPVTALVVARGARSPHAGAWVAAGHALVELPLMGLVYLGAGLVFEREPVRVAVGLLGGMALLAMGVGMLRSRGTESRADPTERSPLLAGAVLSAANPYFLVWWATAGAALMSRSLVFGALGFLLLATVHLSCDLGWCWSLSALTFRGGKFFGPRLQRGVLLVSGLVLLYFGGYFLIGAGLSWWR